MWISYTHNHNYKSWHLDAPKVNTHLSGVSHIITSEGDGEQLEAKGKGYLYHSDREAQQLSPPAIAVLIFLNIGFEDSSPMTRKVWV